MAAPVCHCCWLVSGNSSSPAGRWSDKAVRVGGVAVWPSGRQAAVWQSGHLAHPTRNPPEPDVSVVVDCN